MIFDNQALKLPVVAPEVASSWAHRGTGQLAGVRRQQQPLERGENEEPKGCKIPGGAVSETAAQSSDHSVPHRHAKLLECKFYAKIPNNCVVKPVLFVIAEGMKGKSSDILTLMSSSSLFQPYKMTQIEILSQNLPEFY